METLEKWTKTIFLWKKIHLFLPYCCDRNIIGKVSQNIAPSRRTLHMRGKKCNCHTQNQERGKKSEQVEKYVTITTVKVIYIKFVLWKVTFIKQIKREVNCPKILYLIRFRTIQDSLKENQKESYLELLISKI